MKIRKYLSIIPDINMCGNNEFWSEFLTANPKPCCPFTHAAVLRGLIYEKGKGGSIRKAVEYGIDQQVQLMYMQVWDRSVGKGMGKKEAHELALKASEAVEDSLV